MSLSSGSIAVTSYRVLGFENSIGLAQLNKAIAPHQARAITVGKATKENLCGWVAPEHAEDESKSSTAHWDMSSCRLLDGYLMRFRIEKRRVPGALLQAIYRDRLQSKSKSSPLGRKARKALKEETKAELLAHALPQLTHVDVFWRNEDLMLFSTSKGVREKFVELFHTTFAKPFDLAVLQLSPPLQGLAEKEWSPTAKTPATNATAGKLAYAVPSQFV